MAVLKIDITVQPEEGRSNSCWSQLVRCKLDVLDRGHAAVLNSKRRITGYLRAEYVYHAVLVRTCDAKLEISREDERLATSEGNVGPAHRHEIFQYVRP